jgi:hypothetical protein
MISIGWIGEGVEQSYGIIKKSGSYPFTEAHDLIGWRGGVMSK